MKHWRSKIGIGSLLALLVLLITVVLKVTTHVSGASSVFNESPALIASFNYLYLVPVLLAAMYVGETGCFVIVILATAASAYLDGLSVLHQTFDSAAWGAVGIRGAFFFTLGYLAARSSGRLRASSRNWQSLSVISLAISSSLDIEETLQAVTKLSVELTSADASAIRLVSDDGTELVYAKTYGLSEQYTSKGPRRVDDSSINQPAIQAGEIIVRNARHTKQPYQEEMRAEGIVSIMHAPLRIEDKVIGMLNLYRKRYTGFTPQDASVAQAFAEHAAIAIQNARLYASIRKNYLDTVRALSRAIEARDSIALGHSERVAETAVAIARVLPLPENEVQILEFGALLHDLGKISLDDQILLRPERLAPDEEVVLQMHPLIGKSILDPIEFMRPAIPILMYHHERWDGLGYPEGLCAEEIPLLARIVAVANGMDHIMYLSSPFPIPQKIALEELTQEAGTLYDPRIIDALATALRQPAPAPLESPQSIPSV